MPKIEIDLDDERAAYLAELAQSSGVSSEEYILRGLPRRPEPDPPSFPFEGTVMRKSLGNMWYVLIDGKEDFQAFLSDMTTFSENRWMYKRFRRGARVEGQAQRFNQVYRVIWMVPAGTNRYKNRTFWQRIMEKLSYLPWLLNTQPRKQAIAAAMDQWRKFNSETKTAGA